MHPHASGRRNVSPVNLGLSFSPWKLPMVPKPERGVILSESSPIHGDICLAVLFLSCLWLHVHKGHCSVVLPSYPQVSSIFALSVCLSFCLYLFIPICLFMSLSANIHAFQGMGSFCFSYKRMGCRKSSGLSSSWVHGSNYKGPGHMGILWGHLQSISLDTLQSSLSTCHFLKLFLRKGTQASSALKSPKPTEFLFRNVQKWTFLSQRHTE